MEHSTYTSLDFNHQILCTSTIHGFALCQTIVAVPTVEKLHRAAASLLALPTRSFRNVSSHFCARKKKRAKRSRRLVITTSEVAMALLLACFPPRSCSFIALNWCIVVCEQWIGLRRWRNSISRGNAQCNAIVPRSCCRYYSYAAFCVPTNLRVGMEICRRCEARSRRRWCIVSW